MPARRRKRRRLGASTTEAARLRAERPDGVWALDLQLDTTSDGRILKCLHLVDEHTREALAIEVARRIDADRTVWCSSESFESVGARPSSCAWTTGRS